MDYLDPDSESSPLAAGSPLAPDDAPPPPAGFKPVAVKPPSSVVPSPPPGFKPILPKPDGGISGGIQNQAKKLTGADRDPDVDYAAGAPWNIQIALKRADSPDEARAMLERRVGKENVGQDKAGTWWVKIDGEKIAVSPEDGFAHPINSLSNLGVGMAATSPVMAGAAGGALAGVEAGPPGMMIGAGLGAAAGKAADTAEKGIEGTLRGSPAEIGGNIVKEGLGNAALQGVGSAVGAVVKPAANWLKEHFLGVTPDIAAKLRRLLAEGATPPINVAAPGAKAAAADQQLRNLLMGDPKEGANVKYLIDGARRIVASGDVPESVVNQSMIELLEQNARIGGTAVGKDMQRAAQEEFAGLHSDLQNARDAASAYLKNQEQSLRQYADGQTGRLGEDIADSIIQKRQEFAATMRQAYAALDREAGNARIVPVGPFRNMAKAMKLTTPENQLTPLIDQLAESDPNLKLTFSEWHDLRTMLRDNARTRMTSLAPGVRAHRALEAAKSAHDLAYDPSEEIAAQMDQTDLFGQIERSEVPPEVLADLKKTDDLYKQGIAKFNNATMNRLVKDAKDGLFVDPNYVSKMIVAPGHTEQTRMIMSLLPQETKDQVARADLHNLLVSASDPNTGMVSGKILRSLLADPSRKRVMKEVYEPMILRQASKMADELAALNGDVDLRSIKDFSGSGIQQALQTAITKQRDLQAFVKNGVLRHLIDADPKVVDAAADEILSGGKEHQLERVHDFLGEDSVAWFNLRQYAKKKALYNAVVERPSTEKTIGGQSIQDVMSNLTEKEQDLLFPNGEKEDLRMLATDAKFLFPRTGSDFGGSLAARAIQFRIPFHVRADLKWAESKFVGYLTQHPSLMRWLADSERTRPGSFKILAGPIMRWVANAETSGPGQGAAPPPENPTQGIYGGGL